MNEQIKLQAFRMHANVYFIGSEAVSVHLLDTEKGLVLIDTGYPKMRDLIFDNIAKLGFSVKDICAIFHSHGHIDHFGNTIELARLSGAKTHISRIDNDIVNGTLPLSWAKELKLDPIPPFSCDVLLEDGDVFDFGNTQIRCLHTPGHTDGVMSFIITLSDGKIAAMHGGIGMNSMRSEFLREYGLSFECRQKFKDGLERLSHEKVDIVLGNHPEQNDTVSKLQRILGGADNILNPEHWQRFLAMVNKKIDNLIETDPEI